MGAHRKGGVGWQAGAAGGGVRGCGALRANWTPLAWAGARLSACL